jgi:uncharacterized protein (TIGR01319 family)
VTNAAACADVGSTFTKVAVVDLDSGELVGSAARPTTTGTDVLHGLDEAVDAAGGTGYPLYVCSSAGGGLRLAVVGYEQLVSARAGQRVGLTSGARVVHVSAGPLDGAGIAALRGARPDVVLLVGGTDGGDSEILLHNAARLGAARLRVPVVAAGNRDARPAVLAALAAGRVPVVPAGTVLPRIGVLDAGPARKAIREVFLRHVIGGKRLSRGPRFPALVRGATPDLVLRGIELLADRLDADLLVVDVGGATTDVYSARRPDAEREAGPRRPVAGQLWRDRTVEGDLGMRWSAAGVVAAAEAERLLTTGEVDGLREEASSRAASPDVLVGGESGWAVEARLAGLAATIAVRRHARPEVGGDGARDLRDVRLVIGSGGVLRHAPPGTAVEIISSALADHAGGWALPREPTIAVDVDYVLAAAGLLADEYPAAAAGLLRSRLPAVQPMLR